jgi:ABC-type Co2+ transport system permease subunit
MRNLKLCLLASFAVLLAGCATLNNITATQTVIINQVLTLGAEVYIQKAGGTAVPPALYSTAQQARAQAVYNDAAEIAGFAAGTITVTQLDSALAKWVAAGKTPLDQGLRAALVAEVNILLATKVNTGVLNAAATALVTDVATDFETAALAYGAVANPALKR